MAWASLASDSFGSGAAEPWQGLPGQYRVVCTEGQLLTAPPAPNWDALGGFSITNLGTATLIPPHTQQTRVRAHLLASLSALALCGVPTSPAGRTQLLPALPWHFPMRWQGWDRTPPAPVLPPPAELSCAGLKTACFSPPLKCQCFEPAFWKFPI